MDADVKTTRVSKGGQVGERKARQVVEKGPKSQRCGRGVSKTKRKP